MGETSQLTIELLVTPLLKFILPTLRKCLEKIEKNDLKKSLKEITKATYGR